VLPVACESGQGQKVIEGDTSGVLQCFYYNKGSLLQVFKGVPGPRKINCVVTGVGPSQRDKAFVAEGSVVRLDADNNETPAQKTSKASKFHFRSSNISQLCRSKDMTAKAHNSSASLHPLRMTSNTFASLVQASMRSLTLQSPRLMNQQSAVASCPLRASPLQL
jgi:hypothetical protein